jgi:predicted metal-dependent phosphoesterase TrpH
MKSQVDLHLHSTASDGKWTPTALVQFSLQEGLQAISLTDHDTTGGVQEALDAARGTPLTVIAGVEMSTQTRGASEIHILGYHIDHVCAPLQECLARLRESRLERARKVLRLLAQNHCPVSWQRVSAFAGSGSVGRPHIAQAMVEANYVDSVESAFRHYLGRGGPAYVPRAKLLPQKAIQLIRDAGGVPVLAHPRQVIEQIPTLVRYGLMGIEAYYPDYVEAESTFLVGLARKHHLIVTGGTDFHGGDITSASAPGTVYVPLSVVQELRARAGHMPRHDRT